MQTKDIVLKFVEALAASRSDGSTIAIKVSEDPILNLPGVSSLDEGLDWSRSIQPGSSYDFVMIDLPLGMRCEKTDIGGHTITTQANWVELSKALTLLAPGGLCVATVEPSAFGVGKGPAFQKALEDEGFYLNGVFNTPAGLLKSTSIRPVIVAFSREVRPGLFVAELEGKVQASMVATSFARNMAANSLHEGMSIEDRRFDGFERLKARLQLGRLETQYKDYESHALDEIALEINTVRSGELFELKENSIYIPMVGNTAVTDDISAVTIKHQHIIQVVLPDTIKSQYVAAFFRSDLGLLVLRSLACGAIMPRIKKSDLAQAQIAVPSLQEQEVIVRSHSQLQTLTMAIRNFQSELALNPRSASEIGSQVESMLEMIGRLTDADRIRSMARQGESATIEFKQTFSLDVRKKTKEKYIELSSLKTIVAFLNTDGGVLLVGVTDVGESHGVEAEVNKFHQSNDAFLLYFKNQLKERIGEQYYPFIRHKLVDLGDVHVLMVECTPAATPCYLDGKDFYVRTNPATDKLEGPKLVEYVKNHFK